MLKEFSSIAFKGFVSLVHICAHLPNRCLYPCPGRWRWHTRGTACAPRRSRLQAEKGESSKDYLQVEVLKVIEGIPYLGT